MGEDEADMTVMELLRGATATQDSGEHLRDHPRPLLLGVGAALASAMAFVLPALVVWVAAPQSTVSWTSALGVGASLWLLGGGAHLSLGGAVISVVPLLFLGLAVVGGAWAAVRAVRPAADDRTVVHLGGLVHRRLGLSLGAWAIGYAAGAALLSLVAFAAGPHPQVVTLVLPVVGVPAGSALLALWWLVRGRPELAGPRLRRPHWLPDAVRRGVRPGLEAAAVLLGVGALLCVVVVLRHLDRVGHLQGELAPGVVGGVVLTLSQLLVLPNLALWAVSFLAGTGFSAVAGASVSWTGSRSSLLPLVPVYGSLPEPGAFPGLLPLVVLLPVAAGALVGWRSLRSVARLSTTRTKLMVTATGVVVGAGALGLLDVVGGGALGSRRLADVGAPAGWMTLALLGELAVGAALVLAWDRWKLRR
jgi:hypothetical protein